MESSESGSTGEGRGGGEGRCAAVLCGRTFGGVALHSGMWAVCFTDLVGSTEQRARLGDHAGDALRREHDDIVARAAQEHGGIVVKGTGDGS